MYLLIHLSTMLCSSNTMASVKHALAVICFLVVTFNQCITQKINSSECDSSKFKCPPCDGNEQCRAKMCIPVYLSTYGLQKEHIERMEDFITHNNAHQYCKSKKCVADAKHLSIYCTGPSESTNSR